MPEGELRRLKKGQLLHAQGRRRGGRVRDQAAPGCAGPLAEPEASGKLWRVYHGEGQGFGESRGSEEQGGCHGVR